MSDIDILKDFKEESKVIIEELIKMLEEIDGDFKQVKRLEEYGQQVDRIMGGAKSLALTFDKGHFVHKVADYSALCKAVGYKASQIESNENFYNVCVALLLDATEVLSEMIKVLEHQEDIKMGQLITQTFLDRLRWVSNQFGAEVRSSIAVQPEAKKRMSQSEIDDLLKKLGL